MKMVRYKQSQLPPLTEAEKVELHALAQRPDSEIDYSDLPPLDVGFWQRTVPLKNAVRNRPHKQVAVTASMDTDVLDWLQNQGQEWQQQMNAILRAAMQQAQANM